MDGTGEHYAKWNKPGGEGQIPYDLTFNWNIINIAGVFKHDFYRVGLFHWGNGPQTPSCHHSRSICLEVQLPFGFRLLLLLWLQLSTSEIYSQNYGCSHGSGGWVWRFSHTFEEKKILSLKLRNDSLTSPRKSDKTFSEHTFIFKAGKLGNGRAASQAGTQGPCESLCFLYYLLILRRESERETSICCSTDLCIRWLILVCALTGDWTLTLGVWGPRSNQLSHPARAL